MELGMRNWEFMNDKKDNVVQRKSFAFAKKVIFLCRSLRMKSEYEISRQLLRSGTSIGANIEEAIAGQSKRDFLAKMYISAKEARETRYWLRLLDETEAGQLDYSNYLKEIDEICTLLSSITKTTRERLA